MGLDMYLSRKTYVRNWDFRPAETHHHVTVTRNGQPVPHIKPERVSYVEEAVGQWRKANAIHKWFLDNCNDGGEDDCSPIPVTREKLVELLEKCKAVLAAAKIEQGQVLTGKSYLPNGRIEEHREPGRVIVNQDEIAAMLPTQQGFFFGGTDYDEGYLQHLEDTIAMLEPLLAETSDTDFVEYVYKASW